MVLQIDLITQSYASIFQKILKEGPLLKNCNSFKRWKLRYFLVRGQRLCFAHHPAVREYIYIHTHTYIHTHINVYVYIYIHICVNCVSRQVPGNNLRGDKPRGKDMLARIKVDNPNLLHCVPSQTISHYVVAVQSLSRPRLFATPWTAALQATLSFTTSRICSNSCLLSQ